MAASRVACGSFNLGTNTTITITRDNKAYTHTLKYSFNGATGTIATKTTQTSVVWTPPASTFYAKIPNSTSGYGTITCETYNGNTLIGSSICGFYAYAVKANCLPTVTGAVVDTNAATIAVTGDASKLVRYLSKPKATLTATGKNSATIKTIQIENPVGLVATTSPYTFDTVYSSEFRFKATDSRGYSTTTKATVPTFIEYDPCYFDKEPAVVRTESTSTTATATLTGYCFKGSFGSVSNTLTVKYRYKTSTGAYGSYVTVTPTWNSNGTFTATATISGLSLNETYTIEFVVQDKLTSFPVEVVLGQGTGDLRIAKDYVQTKNNFIIGDANNTAWRKVLIQRKINDVAYGGQIGVALVNSAGVLAQELYKSGVMQGRVELRTDGHLYNYLNSLSFAEIMSLAPSTVTNGGQGYLLLNGGDSAAPILVQWGRLTVTPDTANVVKTVKVNFNYQFLGLPFVCSDIATTAPDTIFATVGDVTNTSFNIYMKRATATATAILWFAIGNGSNALPE